MLNPIIKSLMAATTKSCWSYLHVRVGMFNPPGGLKIPTPKVRDNRIHNFSWQPQSNILWWGWASVLRQTDVPLWKMIELELELCIEHAPACIICIGRRISNASRCASSTNPNSRYFARFCHKSCRIDVLILTKTPTAVRLDWISVSLHKYTQTRVMQLGLRQSDCRIYRGRLSDLYLCHLSDFRENNFCKC